MIRLLIFSFLITATYFTKAQTTLSFCTSVEKDGYCAFYNTKFITSPDSSTGRIYMLLRNPSGIRQKHVTYHIFTLDKNGTETLINKIEQSMEPDWIYAWQTGTFQSPGKYRIKVFTDAGQLLCNKSFELFNVW
jgi:hypothetical protein